MGFFICFIIGIVIGCGILFAIHSWKNRTRKIRGKSYRGKRPYSIIFDDFESGYFRGKQWTEDEKAVLKAQESSPLVINRIQGENHDRQEGQ